jgi:hypothetical protein
MEENEIHRRINLKPESNDFYEIAPDFVINSQDINFFRLSSYPTGGGPKSQWDVILCVAGETISFTHPDEDSARIMMTSLKILTNLPVEPS